MIDILNALNNFAKKTLWITYKNTVDNIVIYNVIVQPCIYQTVYDLKVKMKHCYDVMDLYNYFGNVFRVC